MKISATYQEHLTNNNLFLLHQLPEKIQAIAIDNVMKHEYRGFLGNIESAKNAVKLNIHACINELTFVRQLYEYSKVMKQESFRREVVEANLCEFYANGSYKTYTDD